MSVLEHALATDFKHHSILLEVDDAFFHLDQVMELVEIYK